MKLEVLNLALEAIELLRPIVIRIKKHDRNLARQITDAANSSVLNTGEGARQLRWHWRLQAFSRVW